MYNYWLWYYFGIINLISGIVFIVDKNAAINSRHRIPEITLHFLELLGGAFANLLLMYTFHHKNRKFRYWVWTWLVMISWMIILNYINF